MPQKKRELELSTYEKQRLENIARNKEKMFSLGLTSIKKALEEIEQPEAKKKKTQSTQVEVEIETETILVRRSSRINPSTTTAATTIQKKRRVVKVKEEPDSSSEDSSTEIMKEPKIKKEKRLKKKKKTKPVFDEDAFITRLEKEIKEILSKSESSKRARLEKNTIFSDTTPSKRAKPQPQTSNNSSTPLKRSSTSSSTTQTELSFLFSKKQKLHHSKQSLATTTPSSTSTSSSTSQSKIPEKGEPSQELKSFALINGDLLQTKKTIPLCLSTDFGMNELSKSQSVCTTNPSFHLKLYGDDNSPYTLYSNSGLVHLTESKNSYSCPLQQIDNIFLTSPSPSKAIICTWDQSRTDNHCHSHSLGKVNNNLHPTLSSSPIESKYLSFSDKTYGRKNLKSVIPSLPLLELDVPEQKPCLDHMQREE